MSDRSLAAERIRVRGLVQGVGFRPTVWRLARELGLSGEVRNDGEGVLIQARGAGAALETFCQRLVSECPILARIDSLERQPWPAGLAALDSAAAEAGAGRGTEADSRTGADAGSGTWIGIGTGAEDGDRAGTVETEGFHIRASVAGRIETGVVADAATCAACAAEIADPADRRYRYPFANCTHCGPRLSIVRAIPYDRANTSMAAFPLCPDCRREYEDPADRRFHAQPIACPVCGPRAWLEDVQGQEIAPASLDAVDAVAAASRLLAQGQILAIKGIGGFHLACDATNAQAVAALRQRKGRYRKPFALMARDLEVIRRYAWLTEVEASALQSPAAPVMLLDKKQADPTPLADQVAPGQTTLGFMLPYSPLHRLLLRDWNRPLVMTSGNRSEEPQCIANDDARQRLTGLADAFLLHDREIFNRVDDSVLRVMDGEVRPLRRARGLAPLPLNLPPGFAVAAPVLALGGELKNTICLLRSGTRAVSAPLAGSGAALVMEEGVHPLPPTPSRVGRGGKTGHALLNEAPLPISAEGDGAGKSLPTAADMGGAVQGGGSPAQAILSQHLGDLEDARTADEFERTLGLFQALFHHRPVRLALDLHPDYRSTLVGQALAAERGIEVVRVQHHFAHIASVLADAGWPLDAGAVLGIAFDGLGWGADGTVWGGEFLVADYRGYERLGQLRPVPLPGGARAIREPWRNLYAQLATCLGWEEVTAAYPDLELTRYLATKPLATLDTMMARGLNSPQTSSAGRLFDAVAAALGLCRDGISYEGQAAIELETLAVTADARALTAGETYPFGLVEAEGRWLLDPAPFWRRLLEDLANVPLALSLEGRDQVSQDRDQEGTGQIIHDQDLRDTGQVIQERLIRAAGLQNLKHARGSMGPVVKERGQGDADQGIHERALGIIAARFHLGLARAAAELAVRLAEARGLDTVALSGGVMQNKTLFEALARELRGRGMRVLSHRQVPANDGGLALGQAVIAAASLIPTTLIPSSR